METFTIFIGLVFACTSAGIIAWNVIMLIGFVIAEIKWPNNKKSSGQPNIFGVYQKDVPEQEKNRQEKQAFLVRFSSLSAIVIFAIAGIAAVILSLYIKTPGSVLYMFPM